MGIKKVPDGDYKSDTEKVKNPKENSDNLQKDIEERDIVDEAKIEASKLNLELLASKITVDFSLKTIYIIEIPDLKLKPNSNISLNYIGANRKPRTEKLENVLTRKLAFGNNSNKDIKVFLSDEHGNEVILGESKIKQSGANEEIKEIPNNEPSENIQRINDKFELLTIDQILSEFFYGTNEESQDALEFLKMNYSKEDIAKIVKAVNNGDVDFDINIYDLMKTVYNDGYGENSESLKKVGNIIAQSAKKTGIPFDELFFQK